METAETRIDSTEEVGAGSMAPSTALLAAAIAVRDYLESTAAICCANFDIPDVVWVPFTDAIKAEERAANLEIC